MIQFLFQEPKHSTSKSSWKRTSRGEWQAMIRDSHHTSYIHIVREHIYFLNYFKVNRLYNILYLYQPMRSKRGQMMIEDQIKFWRPDDIQGVQISKIWFLQKAKVATLTRPDQYYQIIFYGSARFLLLNLPDFFKKCVQNIFS